MARPPSVPMERYIALFEDGLSDVEIAKQLETTDRNVRRKRKMYDDARKEKDEVLLEGLECEIVTRKMITEDNLLQLYPHLVEEEKLAFHLDREALLKAVKIEASLKAEKIKIAILHEMEQMKLEKNFSHLRRSDLDFFSSILNSYSKGN